MSADAKSKADAEILRMMVDQAKIEFLKKRDVCNNSEAPLLLGIGTSKWGELLRSHNPPPSFRVQGTLHFRVANLIHWFETYDQVPSGETALQRFQRGER